jgi:FkbM family methyltransferase
MIPDSLKPWVYPLRPYYLRVIGKSLPKPDPEDSALRLYPNLIGPSDVVIEVGGNVGGGALFLSSLAKYVYSFEPVRMNFIMLRVNTRKRRNVSAFNSAVGSENGYGTINLRKKNVISIGASLTKAANAEYNTTQKVRLIRLDSFHFEHKPTVLIIDCEGYEREVLRGAEQTTSALRMVLVETHTLANGLSTASEVKTELAKLPGLEVTSCLVDGRYGPEEWIMAQSSSS